MLRWQHTMKLNALRFFMLVGALAIVATFFFGTLFALDFMERRSRDLVRVEPAKSIMKALEKYREARGAYPVLLPPQTDNVSELSAPLIGSGYLDAISQPPGAPPSSYISPDGKMYGLWIHLERTGDCIIEVRISNTGWWNERRPCVF
jgi:hypothetical protein